MEIQVTRSEHTTALCEVFLFFFLFNFFNGKNWSVICSGVGVRILVSEGLLVPPPAGNEGGSCHCCAWGHNCVAGVSQ